MFDTVAGLDPDSMHAVALAVYTEMVNAGYGTVGEFHYVHHQPDGTPYAEPNAMAIAVAEAAQDGGNRDRAAARRLPPQRLARRRRRAAGAGPAALLRPGRRDTFLARVDELRAWAARQDRRERRDRGALGARGAGALADTRSPSTRDAHDLVRHVHAQEQPRELEQCQAEHGCSPLELLEAHGFLGPRTTVVHAIHVSDGDVARLASSRLDRRRLPDHRGQPR